MLAYQPYESVFMKWTYTTSQAPTVFYFGERHATWLIFY